MLDCTFSEKTYDKMMFSEHQTYKEYYGILETWAEVQLVIDKWVPPLVSANSATPAIFTKEALRNSLYYIFHKYRDAIYVQIRGSQVSRFNLLQNVDYRNPLSSFIKVRGSAQNTDKWIDNGGVVRPFPKKWDDYQISLSYYETKMYIMEVAKLGVPDCDFVVNTRERLVLKADLTEASEELVGSLAKPLDKRFRFDTFVPFLSFNWNERYSDIAIPTPDDINRIFRTFCPPGGTNSYLNDERVPWAQKTHAVAVFRGSFTGASADPKINQRLHLASLRDPAWLDAGITSFNSKYRYRKSIKSPYLEVFDVKLEKKTRLEPMTMDQQKKYKYVVYAEGNVGAYRGAYLFSFGSVVLWIRPYKYRLWFEPWLKDKKNCMMVKSDLSDLRSIVLWLRKNDAAAAKIADNGRKLYDKCLTKEALLAYGRDVLHRINPVARETSEENLLIIVPFADLRPEECREEQLRKFISHFQKSGLRTTIVIAEQVAPKDQFNRGMLINLGVYWYTSRSGSPKVIVTHDVDMLPNKELLSQYNNSNEAMILFPNSPTAKSTYGYQIGIGGAISSFQYDVFKRINGYPNTFWGWGGEDNALEFRIKTCGIKPVMVKKGDFINTDAQRLSGKGKMDYLNKNKIRNMQAWEGLARNKKNWRVDGYAQLDKANWEACEAVLLKASGIRIIRVKFKLGKHKKANH